MQMGFILAGIFSSMLGAWLGQGRYAMAPFMCFLIGFLAKQHNEQKEIRKAEQENAQPLETQGVQALVPA